MPSSTEHDNKIKAQIRSFINPDLNESSKKTYISQIKSVYTNIFGNEIDFKPEKFTFQNIKKFGDSVENVNRRKTMYAALLQIIKDNDKLKENVKQEMLKTITIYNNVIKQQDNKKNWISYQDIFKKYRDLERRYKPLMNDKNLNAHDMHNIQKFVIIGVMGGLFIPPRRNQDYILMKTANIDMDNDNYIDHKTKEFVFNKYKTSKIYGQQRVDIPPKLYAKIKKFIALKKDKSDYLFTQMNYKPFSSPTFTQFLNNIFPGEKKIGTNSFRHTFLTKKYGNTVELHEDLQDMGTSLAQLQTYVKKDKTE